MRWSHPEHPGRDLRLAYCLNLHPAEDLDGVLAGLEAVTLPLARGLSAGTPDAPFGVGPWLAASLAHELAAPGSPAFARFADFLAEHHLEAFTWNAFPFGGFHAAGLKQRVFEPTWLQPERLAYTLAVAEVAARVPLRDEPDHVSISTHPGGFGNALASDDDARAAAESLARCVAGFARLEQEHGRRLVLSLEAEPRASSGDTAELAAFRARVPAWAEPFLASELDVPTDRAAELLARHLGTCLDACHAAVEFEPADEAIANATRANTPLGKLQFSSALRLPTPADDPEGRAALLGMAEEVFLHQVTGRRDDTHLRVQDLPELSRALESPDTPWLTSDEWRCHFHVPVDLDGTLDGAGRLTTTRALADDLAARLLTDPSRWNLPELHFEIETYTWNVLPGPVRGPGDLAGGLSREYAHVHSLLQTHGWTRS